MDGNEKQVLKNKMEKTFFSDVILVWWRHHSSRWSNFYEEIFWIFFYESMKSKISKKLDEQYSERKFPLIKISTGNIKIIQSHGHNIKLENRVKPVYKHHPWDPKIWPLLTGGHFSEVIYVIKIQNVTPNRWSLFAGGCYFRFDCTGFLLFVND